MSDLTSSRSCRLSSAGPPGAAGAETALGPLLTAAGFEGILGRPPAEVLSFDASGARLSFEPSRPGAPLALGQAKPDDYRRYHAHNCKTLPDSVRQLFELFLALVGPVPSLGQLGSRAEAAAAAFREAGLGRSLGETFLFSIGLEYWAHPRQRYAAAWAVQSLPLQPRVGIFHLGLCRRGQALGALVTARPLGSHLAWGLWREFAAAAANDAGDLFALLRPHPGLLPDFAGALALRAYEAGGSSAVYCLAARLLALRVPAAEAAPFLGELCGFLPAGLLGYSQEVRALHPGLGGLE